MHGRDFFPLFQQTSLERLAGASLENTRMCDAWCCHAAAFGLLAACLLLANGLLTNSVWAADVATESNATAPQQPNQQPSAPPATPTAPAIPGAPDIQDMSMPPGNRAFNPMTQHLVEAMMRRLVKEGIWSQNILDAYTQGQNPTVTRAAFADILIKVLREPPDAMVSEFPVYRDVPRDHWAYRAIEIARERRLMTNTPDGYFRPEATITNLEAYLALANTLAGKDPSPELADAILKPYSDFNQLPLSTRPTVARLVNARVIIPRPGTTEGQLRPNSPLHYGKLAALLSREAQITGYERLILPVQAEILPLLPPGIPLQVVPTSAIFKSKLAMGSTVYFALVQATPAELAGKKLDLPMNSRIEGELATILNNGEAYQVKFKNLQTPDGRNYQLHGTILLSFESQNPDAFIVPGAPYQTFSTP